MDLIDVLSGRTAQPPPPVDPYRDAGAPVNTVTCSGCHRAVPDSRVAHTAQGLRCDNCRRIANEAVAATMYDRTIAAMEERQAQDRRNYWIMRGVIFGILAIGAVIARTAMDHQWEEDRQQAEGNAPLYGP